MRGPLEIPRRRIEGEPDPARIAELRRLMGNSLGPIRNGAPMAQALRQLEGWKARSRAEDDHLLIAQVVLRATLERRESLGAHYRVDRPEPGRAGPSAVSSSRHFAGETLGGASNRVA